MSRLVERELYYEDPAVVARRLLGKLLIRKLGGRIASGMIVETEAYYGEGDPASWASKGDNWIRRAMCGEPGRTLVYAIHGHWLLNVVAMPPGIPAGVLIRALEPVEGLDLMARNRGVDDPRLLTSGPGRLTQALAIDKSLHGLPVYEEDSPIQIAYYREVPDGEVARSKRIGVKRDLDVPLRFYVKGNPYISKLGKRRLR